MADEEIFASAQPEKRLFISLLTRDVSLIDAVLDLIDNSINSAIIMTGRHFRTPDDYIQLLDVARPPNIPEIEINFSESDFTVEDRCGGISLEMAERHVFRFGRPEERRRKSKRRDDTLSVYGIGLKRAIFKIGDHIKITSAHPSGGFQMDLRVRRWESTEQLEWQIPISPFSGRLDGGYGVKIVITDLYDDIKRRIGDGAFSGDLERRIARTYNYFLERVVSITVDGKVVSPVDVQFGSNVASDSFEMDDVSCAVIAAIGVPIGKFHVAETAGWYVFCNGRAIAFADKTPLTGWGVFLPTFQPKHRPFIGLVFFTSDSPENLPWTTTKSSINQEASVWQHALRVMGTVGRQITSYLDDRYSDEGTEITADELSSAAGRPASAFRQISTESRSFVYRKEKKDTTSVQFRVRKTEINEIKEYLGRRGMSNGEVGRHTFDYFLENVVRE